LARALDALRALDVRGVNVTVPHKQAIMPLLSEVEASARAIGAVNTVRRDGDRLIGATTDAAGLSRALRQAAVELSGARVTVLGAGGAARAAVVGLAQAGAQALTVAARNETRALALVGAVGGQCGAARLSACDLGYALRAAFRQTDVLIQATSATLGEGAGPAAFAASLPFEELPAHAVVCDLVYKPRVTSVLRRAAESGLRPVDGTGMLLHQGALAFECWTNRPAPLEVMAAALEGC
jgi:shikimate dehydrogenase